MVDKKDLRNGVAVMRLVAQLLSEWADDMERAQGAGRKKKTAGPAPAVEETPAPVQEDAVAETEDSSAAPVAPAVPLDSAHVLALLTEKCAAGFGTQVQALINSFGAGKFSELDPAHYPALLEAVQCLGNSGGDADAG